MSDEENIKDETLRLVLSTDQGQWLRKRIHGSRLVVWAMLNVVVFFLGGATYLYSGPQPPDQSLTIVDGLIIIPIPFAFLTLLRHLYLLRKYKKYLADHQAFLAKYNRL